MPERYIGLMSGTSMDAVDAVLLELGSDNFRLLAHHSHPIPAELRQELDSLSRGPADLERVARMDVRIGRLFAEAANTLLRNAQLSASDIRAIGSHGQTIRHQPGGSDPFTIQIGDPNLIAEKTGITTVADLRRRDIAAGGQGAPLVPAFHAHIFRDPREARIILNIGGIANITTMPSDPAQAITGFDTGPANTLMDQWIHRCKAMPFDRDGTWAASGQVQQALLQTLLSDPYFSQAAPKSTGTDYFNLDWLQRIAPEQGCSEEDMQATLAELTAASIHAAIQQTGFVANRIIVCGGGAYNRYLMGRLQALAGSATVSSSTEFGLPPEWVEGAAFAWLAQRTLSGLPGNLPSVTGASHPVILGGIYPA